MQQASTGFGVLRPKLQAQALNTKPQALNRLHEFGGFFRRFSCLGLPADYNEAPWLSAPSAYLWYVMLTTLVAFLGDILSLI